MFFLDQEGHVTHYEQTMKTNMNQVKERVKSDSYLLSLYNESRNSCVCRGEDKKCICHNRVKMTLNDWITANIEIIKEFI
jgi:hypothetical protein